jgi:hypothetical protein
MQAAEQPFLIDQLAGRALADRCRARAVGGRGLHHAYARAA